MIFRDHIIQIQYTPFSLGSVLENIANIFPVAIRCQEIHPYSAVNIYSVKINISLMRECEIHTSLRVYTLSTHEAPYSVVTYKVPSDALQGTQWCFTKYLVVLSYEVPSTIG